MLKKLATMIVVAIALGVTGGMGYVLMAIPGFAKTLGLLALALLAGGLAVERLHVFAGKTFDRAQEEDRFITFEGVGRFVEEAA